MSTITTLASGDNGGVSRTTINTNFSNLNTDKMETSVLDTDTTLAANSDAKVATQKAVKAYVDAGGDVNLQAALTGGGSFGTPSGSNKFITEDYLGSTPVAFGGTGVDGALSITSGTTTIDLGGAEIVYLNYTSVSITGTGKLAFTNKAAAGTLVYIKCQGNVTLTSSATPNIDLDGIGASGGAVGNAGTEGFSSLGFIGSGAFPGYGAGGVAAAGGVSPRQSRLAPRQIIFGTGGGSGATTDGGANNGAGSAGGGALVIECAGAWNFTSTIYARGIAGTAGGGGGSGGGGGGGSVHVLYNTLTANSGVVTVTGGAAGAAGGTGSGDNGSGGGASIANDGSPANATTRVGGAGGNGFSSISQNLWF